MSSRFIAIYKEEIREDEEKIVSFSVITKNVNEERSSLTFI